MAETFTQFFANFGDPVQMGIAKVISNIGILLERLPVKRIDGLLHKYGSLESEGGVGTRKVNAPFPATAQSVVTPVDERVMIAGAQCKVDHRLVGANQAARSEEIARRSRVISRYTDHSILMGEGKTDQEKIIGLKDRLAAPQLIDAGTNGADLTLAMIYALLDACEDQGAGRFMLMPRKLFRAFKTLLVAAAGGATVADLAGPVPQFEGVQIIVTGKNHLGAELLDFTEVQGSYSTAASIYCFAPGTSEDNTGVQTLMASNSIEVIDEGTRDSMKIDTVEIAFGVALYHPRAASRLRGVKKPT